MFLYSIVNIKLKKGDGNLTSEKTSASVRYFLLRHLAKLTYDSESVTGATRCNSI